MQEDTDITPIGITNFRNVNQPFGIKDDDRGHIYVLGKSGVGKSTLLKNMALSDIRRGNAVCVIDPHSDVASWLLDFIPAHRINDVIYFNPKDLENPIPFNPLKAIHPNYHHLVASGIISTFKKVWSDSWGPRMEHILRFSLLTLLQYPQATLLDIQRLLTDADFRAIVLPYVTDEHIHRFWKLEFEKYNKTFQMEAVSPILNKLGLLTASLPLRNTLGQKTRGLRLQEIMDGKKILIANLSKGELGEDASMLLGCLLITAIQSATLHRAKQDISQRVPFYLYIDEVQSFATLSFADILAEAKKYALSLYITHQYIDQLDERIRTAIFGNVGTMIVFRIGATDAQYLKYEFEPVFDTEDMVNLPKYGMYIKLMIDGATSRPFSAYSLPCEAVPEGTKEEVIKASRSKFGLN